MEDQPNEIIKYILSYLENRELNIARRVNHRWKNLIEELFYKPVTPSLHMCILNRDHYHFGKHYLSYDYDNKSIFYDYRYINDYCYYRALIMMVHDPYFMRYFKRDFLRDHGSLSRVQILYYGCHKGHLEVVKHLVNNGVDIHQRQDQILEPCSVEGYLEIIKYLVSKGANIHAFYEDALKNSARCGHLDIVKYLVDQGADIHMDHDLALRNSAAGGHLEITKYLISKGADTHAKNDEIFRLSPAHIMEYLNQLT